MTAPPTVDLRPPLFGDRAFWGMCVAQFLGAFNDNVTKQLALLVCLRETEVDRQALATAVFALPFLLFSGFAGFLADRVSKTTIVRGCKAAEVFIQAAGLTAALLAATRGGLLYPSLVVVLFFMGAHSAVFGPPKYGVLPELFRKDDLPQANGVFLMTTFLAIILGAVFAGWLLKLGGAHLPSGVVWGCSGGVVLATVGLTASFFVRMTPPAQPTLRFEAKDVAVDPATWRIVLADRRLLGAMATNGVFYLCGAMMQQAINALGVLQFKLTDDRASMLMAGVALGIAVGCALAGVLCRSKADYRVAKAGAGIATLCATGLGLVGLAEGNFTLQIVAAAVGIFGVGVGGGMLAVPLAVTIQSCAPLEHKGRVLAAMSWFNWVGVLASAVLYQVCVSVRVQFGWPPSVVFLAIAAAMLVVAVALPPRRDAAA